MKSGQQKKSLDRFIYESMGEKQYLISCLDDELFKKALNVNFQRFPTLDAKKLVNAPKMSAHHRGICHF